MHYVKRIDLWERYLRAMDAALSVRAIASYLGIDKDTAFRWRHRILAAARAVPPFDLGGEVRIETTWFTYLEKAPPGATSAAGIARLGSRPVRSRLSPGAPAGDEGRVWVVLAEDERRCRLSETAGCARPTSSTYVALLMNRIRPDTRLVADRGQYSPLAVAARRLSLRYAPRSTALTPTNEPSRQQVLPGEARETHSTRLRRWLRPFRGVSSRYLDRYMLWFNALEVGWRRAMPLPWTIGAS